MKKLLALLVALMVVLAACSGSNTGSDQEKAANVPEESEKTTTEGEPHYRIGISQFVQHDALDQARLGFIDGLAEAGYVDGENITIDYQNAQGEIPNTNTIATKLVNGNNDLILAIATPSAQAMVNATQEIPIVVTAVTDPADAQLVLSNEAPGGNVTGTSDMSPIKEQIDLLVKIAPDAKIIGVLFNSGESNSRLQADIAIEAIEALGLEAREYTISEPSQIQQVTQTAVGQVDALYTPTDNMIAAGMPIVATLAMEHGVPHVGGEKGQVENGALATVGLDYYELGRLSAKQAVRILNGENPGDMPIEYQTNFELTVNEDTLAGLGIQLPEDLV